MQFDTRRGFGCHGAIEILVEPADPAFLVELAECFRTRRSAAVATAFSREAGDAGTRFLRESENRPSDTLVQNIVPPLQLLIVGHGPDSTALHGFAKVLAWQVVAVESATELCGPYDEWTAAIVKTHNYGRDFAALRALLPHRLRYIGLLGPRRRRDELIGDLFDTGLAIEGNLFGPAGLDLGGDSPEAIALAIIAEIQSIFGGGSQRSLRERRNPIHADSGGPLVAAL
jgi:xanthine dehydrogenase accessory factor